MDGITILSETVTNPDEISAIVLIVCGAICTLACIALAVLWIIEDDIKFAFPQFLLAVIAVTSLINGIGKLHTAPYTLYKVTIDKNVSLVEFNEKYEILNQDGLIYEIKERTEE